MDISVNRLRPLLWIALLFAPALAGAQSEPAGGEVPPGYLSAVGIGVSDLERSTDFYVNALGMKKVRTFEISYMNEVLLSYPESSGSLIVLMHWTDGSERNYRDNPVKLVFRVDDPVAFTEGIRAHGGEIVREPAPSAAVGNAVVGFAKDPDGYLIEILPKPAG
jgi:lactoylglutathione lyase